MFANPTLNPTTILFHFQPHPKSTPEIPSFTGAVLFVLLNHLWKIKAKFTTHVPLNLLHLRPLNLILPAFKSTGREDEAIPKSISRTISLRFGREITERAFSFRGKNVLTLLKFSIISPVSFRIFRWKLKGNDLLFYIVFRPEPIFYRIASENLRKK